jgi:Sugar phosphate isomerases/epimerases
MKFGINTLLFTSKYTDEHVKNLSKKIKEWGFDGIEVALEKKGDIDYKKTLKTYKDNGLVCSSVGGLFGGDRDIRGPDKEKIEIGFNYIKDCLEACIGLECDVLSGPIYSAAGRASFVSENEKKVQWDTVVENLGKACKWAEKYGIFIAIEILNRFETDFLTTCKDAIRLIKDIGSKMLKIQLDTFHMNIEEKNSGIAILDAGNLLYLIHTSESDRWTPGTGQVHWKEVADALRRINYNKWAVIEAFTSEDKVMAKAAKIWRQSENENAFIIAEKGVKFLKGILS